MKLVHTLEAPIAGIAVRIRHAVGKIMPCGTAFIGNTPTTAEEKS